MAGLVSPRRPSWRILIAGGGVPGLAAATALGQALGPSVAVTVADPALEGRGPDGRAYALSAGSVAMLAALGIWAELAARAQPIRAMSITDGWAHEPQRTQYLGFEGLEGRDLGTMVEARHLGPAVEAAARRAGVELLAGRVLSFEAAPERGTACFAGGNERRVALLIAADGSRSLLREAAGIGWVGRPYGQSGLVATVRHERDHEGRAIQHFLPAGPFAILPLAPDGASGLPHRSSIVWTENTETASDVLSGPADRRLSALADRFGPSLGGIALETPVVARPLAVGLARRFVGDRLALLGDAAHEIHPLAGQGLNLGLADAAALAERIVDAVRLGLDPGATPVLTAYQRERRPAALALAGLTDGLNRLFSNDLLPVRFVRDLGLGLVDRTEAFKRLLAEGAGGSGRTAPRLLRGEPL